MDRRRPARGCLGRGSHLSAQLVELRCHAPADVAAHRMRVRAPGASDADAMVAARLAAVESRWPGATVVDTTRSSHASLEEAQEVLARPATGGRHLTTTGSPG